MSVSSPDVPRTPAQVTIEVGAPAVIVPIRGGEPVAGEIASWAGSDVGIVVTTQVEVAEGSAEILAGQRVWVRARAQEALVVIQAVATPSGRPNIIEMTGVVGLAVETRRDAVRAELRRSVLIEREGAPSRETWTIDLSSSGCRIRMGQDELQLGERVRAALVPSETDTLWLDGEVVRVDTTTGEAALRFLDAEESAQLALERDVLLWHAERMDEQHLQRPNH